MKLIITILALWVTIAVANAQILKPVKWSYAAKKISATEAVVLIKATIDDGWHVYSQTVKEGGPVKTTFTFPAAKTYTLIGKTIEPRPETKFEQAFNMNVSFFEHEVIFQQKIRLKAARVTVKGQLEYMTCNDKQCLPPEDVDFSIIVK